MGVVFMELPVLLLLLLKAVAGKSPRGQSRFAGGRMRTKSRGQQEEFPLQKPTASSRLCHSSRRSVSWSGHGVLAALAGGAEPAGRRAQATASGVLSKSPLVL